MTQQGTPPTTEPAQNPIKVFVSYANKDKGVMRAIVDGLQEQADGTGGAWEFWYDYKTPVGDEWDDTIKTKMETCDAALLLVTDAFLASKYIYDNEFPVFLKLRNAGNYPVWPVYVSSCHPLPGRWQALGAIQFFRPKKGDYYHEKSQKEANEDLPYLNLLKESRAVGFKVDEHRKYHKVLFAQMERAIEASPSKEVQPEGKDTKNSGIWTLVPLPDLQPGDILKQSRSKYYQADYYHRPHDDAVRQHMASDLPLLVTGNPFSGKSATLYYALQQLAKEGADRTWVAITHAGDWEKKEEIALPTVSEGERLIIFFEDLDVYYQTLPPKVLNTFIENTLGKEHIKLLATCRTGPEMNQLQDHMSGELQNLWLEQSDNKVLVPKVDRKLYNSLQRRYNTNTTYHDFDGNIGSLFLSLGPMKGRYKGIKKLADRNNPKFETAESILYGLKCHYNLANYEGSRSLYEARKIKEFVVRDLEVEKIDRKEWRAALKLLEEDDRTGHAFVKPIGRFLQVEEAYVDFRQKVIAPNRNMREIVEDVQELYPHKDEREEWGWAVDTYAYNNIMKYLGYTDAQTLLQHMIDHEVARDVASYAILMNKAPNLADALTWKQACEAEGIAPNEYTFTILIDKAPSLAQGEAYLNEMRGEIDTLHDPHPWNALIAKKDCPYARGQELLQDMPDAGVKPDDYTFNTLLNKPGVGYSEGRGLLAEMSAAGVRADVTTYNTLLNKPGVGYSEGRELLAEMSAAGVPPNVTTYNTLLNKPGVGYSEGRVLLAEMSAAGVPPNVTTYNTLLNKPGVGYSEGRELLAEMSAAGVRADVHTYTTLLNKPGVGYSEGRVLLAEMSAAGVRADATTYNTLMKKKEVDFAQRKQLIEEMKAAKVRPDVVTYNTLLWAAKSQAQADEAISLMKAEGIRPDAHTRKLYQQRTGQPLHP